MKKKRNHPINTTKDRATQMTDKAMWMDKLSPGHLLTDNRRLPRTELAKHRLGRRLTRSGQNGRKKSWSGLSHQTKGKECFNTRRMPREQVRNEGKGLHWI